MSEYTWQIVLTDEMIAALDECQFFLIEELELSVEIAIGIRDKILDTIESLHNQAFIGQVEPYLKDKNYEYRRLIYSHYKIIYRVEGDFVYVTDVFDSRKNPEKMKG